MIEGMFIHIPPLTHTINIYHTPWLSATIPLSSIPSPGTWIGQFREEAGNLFTGVTTADGPHTGLSRRLASSRSSNQPTRQIIDTKSIKYIHWYHRCFTWGNGGKMKSKWITHQGQRIWYADLRDFGSDLAALQAELGASDEMLLQEPEPVKTITDVRNTTGSREAMELFRVSAAKTKPYVSKAAVVGIEGIRRILLEAVARFSGREFGGFGELEEALDWLVADD